MSWDGPTLLDSFERDGEWWLPGDAPGDRVAGRASFDPAGGVRLKAFRPFSQERSLALGVGFRPPLIQGFWGEGATPVTLYRALRTGPIRPPGDDRGSEFYARYAVDGHHFYEAGDVAFASLRIGFTEQERWAQHHPFAGTMPVPDGGGPRYSPMEPVAAEVGALEARVTVMSDAPSWGLVPMRTLRWEHRVVFEIEPEGRRPLRWYQEVVRGLQDLLALMVGRPVYPTTSEARPHEGGAARADLFFDGGGRPPEGRVAVAGGLSRAGDVFLPLPEVRGALPAALERWFAGRERLAPVHGLFFGALFAPRADHTAQFLSLAQALETYHRRSRPDARYEPEEAYRVHHGEIVGALPPTLPRPLRDRLEQVLKYGNEWSLRKRVKDLLARLPDEGVLESGRERFAQRVVETRNYLTHYPEDSGAAAVRGPELSETLDELRRVLAFLLLQDLGFDDGRIVPALARVPRYGYFPLGD